MINPTSLSRNHISNGPVIITMPIDMINAIENLGINARLIFSLLSSFKFDNEGNNVKTK